MIFRLQPAMAHQGELVLANGCEPWHYRYAGVPYALMMEQYQMGLGEFMSYMKKFTYEGAHLYMNVAGSLVEMYFVEADGEDRSISIPDNVFFTYRGNNVDGYILTIFHEPGKLAG